jgi:hypothetical protein
MVQNSYKATSTIFKLVKHFGELLLKNNLKKEEYICHYFNLELVIKAKA